MSANDAPANAPAVLLCGDFHAAPHRDLLRFVAESGHAPLVIARPPADAADDAVATADQLPAEAADGALLLPGAHPAEIIDRASAWSARYSIRAVFPLDDDYAEAAAWIADLLAIPGPGLRAAVAGRGAGRQTDLPLGYLDEWTVRSQLVPPNSRSAFAADWTLFPASLKRVGRAAGQGTRLVHDTAELLAGFAAAGPNRTLLVEQQPLGEEYVVESLSVRGEVTHMEMTGGVEASDAEDRRQLSDTHSAILRRLAFDSGVAHARYRQLPGGPPTLIAFANGPRRDLSTAAPTPAGDPGRLGGYVTALLRAHR